VSEWWSIEVFDAEELPARRWKDSYQDELIEAAITNGAVYWEWHEHRYGVVFEVLFDSDAQWEAFRALPAVRSALDGVPDPVNGLIIYRASRVSPSPLRPRARWRYPSRRSSARFTWPGSRRRGSWKPARPCTVPAAPEDLNPRAKHPPGRCRMGA
jgi:hypothetical protein